MKEIIIIRGQTVFTHDERLTRAVCPINCEWQSRCFPWNDSLTYQLWEKWLGKYRLKRYVFSSIHRFALTSFNFPLYSWSGQPPAASAAPCTCVQGWTCGGKYGRTPFTWCATTPQSKINIPHESIIHQHLCFLDSCFTFFLLLKVTTNATERVPNILDCSHVQRPVPLIVRDVVFALGPLKFLQKSK